MPEEERGFDLGVYEEELDVEEVTVDTPAPVRAQDHRAREVVMPVAEEADPTMLKRIVMLAVFTGVLAIILGLVVWGFVL